MSETLTLDKFRTYKPIVSTWLSKWWPALATFAVGLLTISYYFTLVFNASDSLPNKVFVLHKQDKAVGRGDFAAFPWEGDRPYPRGLSFVKQVAGVPGDIVEMDEKRDFYIISKPDPGAFIPGATASREPTRKFVGHAKEFGSVGNMRGVPLEPGFTGVIPEGYYYMYAWSKDSLDSRYKLLGLVPKEKILGRAVPLY